MIIMRISLKLFIIMFILTLLFVNANSVMCFEENPCEKFVQSNSEESYQACSNQLRKLSGNAKRQKLLWFYDAKIQKKFLQGVELGKEKYVAIAFNLLPLVDGALSEDLDISLGKSIVRAPQIFLSNLQIHYNNIERLDSLLGNLGPEYVDETEKQLIQLRKRLTAIEKVKDPQLTKIKEIVIRELKTQIDELK